MTSIDALRLRGALQTAGVKYPEKFLELLHAEGFHVAVTPCGTKVIGELGLVNMYEPRPAWLGDGE